MSQRSAGFLLLPSVKLGIIHVKQANVNLFLRFPEISGYNSREFNTCTKSKTPKALKSLYFFVNFFEFYCCMCRMFMV